jgi:hypothetical protein
LSPPESPAAVAPNVQRFLRPPPAVPKGRAGLWFSSPSPLLTAALVILAGALLGFAVSRTIAAGHSGVPGTAGVCGSSMTERVARDVLHGYGARNQTVADHFELRTANCNVRFAIDLSEARRRPGGAAGQPSAGRLRTFEALGYDGVVAIVNPQNPVGQMSTAQLRNIVIGELTSWASLGGRQDSIVVYLPADSSDEARVLSAVLMKGAAVGKSVVRVRSSADAVRAVTAANGRNTIGLVAFSSAVPGKVVRLQEFPAPSVLSIGDRRYPLTAAVTVASLDADRDQTVSGLMAYAGSDEARMIAERDGIITKGVYR